ncbi:MAG TPA: hypothetical protein VD713_01995, partial [Sphingomonadales bacterium]|nr:hypothetical protein [Sphingomonadales bacterium]
MTRRSIPKSPAFALGILILVSCAPALAQDEEFRFKVVDVRGRAFVAGGPEGASARLRMGAKVDD